MLSLMGMMIQRILNTKNPTTILFYGLNTSSAHTNEESVIGPVLEKSVYSGLREYFMHAMESLSPT